MQTLFFCCCCLIMLLFWKSFVIPSDLYGINYYNHEKPIPEHLPLSLSYPDISMNEIDNIEGMTSVMEFKTEQLDEKITPHDENDPPKIKDNIEKEPCPICNKSYSQKALKFHISSVHDGVKPFKCSSCDASFARNNHLRRHYGNVHEGKREFMCILCKDSFTKDRLSIW